MTRTKTATVNSSTGATTATVSDLNADGSLVDQMVTVTSANGLSKTMQLDSTGATSGVVTGALLALAISVGETAPLIYTAGWSNYLWNGKLTHEPIGYLTYVIWSFINQPFAESHALAFAAAFLVMLVVLAINIGVRLVVRRTKFV